MGGIRGWLNICKVFDKINRGLKRWMGRKGREDL